MRKKKWTTPQLIVLVRGRPEEGVLQGCKTAPVAQGFTNVFNNCRTVVASCTELCFSVGLS